uniref:Uncharacterized protein n=1 Tax=Nelumbo nucifera TaxID=4432 RepID=A0A822XM59_NELNU|nr:TPA_asm: hypothetical protein HUJ06_022903 [Nelumbo nucifera]
MSTLTVPKLAGSADLLLLERTEVVVACCPEISSSQMNTDFLSPSQRTLRFSHNRSLSPYQQSCPEISVESHNTDSPLQYISCS